MKISAFALTALLLVLASCEDIPLALTVKEQVADYKASSNPAAPPTFSPPAGTFSIDTPVTLTSLTTGAEIHYTLDGSVPTKASAVYSSPLVIKSPGGVINALAVKAGFKDSTVATASYVINYDQVAPVVISVTTGTQTSDQTNILLSTNTQGATIYYTIVDGSVGTAPTTASAVFDPNTSAPLQVVGDGTVKTIKAFAVKTGLVDSSVSTSTVTIKYVQALAPTITPATGSFNSDQTVTITNNQTGAVVRYTVTNGATGTVPDASSPVYDSSSPPTITVAGDGTVKTIEARAFGAQLLDSPVTVSKVTVNYNRASTPTFTPAAGISTTDIPKITIGADTGATIYYTTSTGATLPADPDPTNAAQIYSTAAALPALGNGTVVNVKALAVKAGLSTSPVATGTFTIQWPTLAVPAFVAGGVTYSSVTGAVANFTTNPTFTLTGPTGSTIYYTTDNSTPTPGAGGTSAVASPATVTLQGDGSVASKAYKIRAFSRRSADALDSPEAALDVSIAYAPVPTPTFSSPTGTVFTVDTPVSITKDNVNVSLYYTTDGSLPSAIPGNAYSGQISLLGSATGTKSYTVNVLAVQSGFRDTRTSAVYQVDWAVAAGPVIASDKTPLSGSGTVGSPYILTANSQVTLSSEIGGASIYYTVTQYTGASSGGTTPTLSSTSFSNVTANSAMPAADLNVEKTFTVNAFVKADTVFPPKQNSPVVSKTYTVSYPRYGVTYNSNGGSGTVPTDSASYLAGAAFTSATGAGLSKASVPVGYWTTGSDGSGFVFQPGVAGTFPISPPASNVTLYAQYYFTSWTEVQQVVPSPDDTLVTTYGLVADSTGQVYIVEAGSRKIRVLRTNGTLDILVSGIGDGSNFDNGDFSVSRFVAPHAVTVDGSGNVYIADGSRIRKMATSSTTSSTVAGTGTDGYLDGDGANGATASTALFNQPYGLVVNQAGTTIYVADSGNKKIRKIDLTTTPAQVSTFYSFTGGSSSPYGITLDSTGNVFVADFGQHVIVKITPAGVGSIFAGQDGTYGFNDATGTAAKFASPWGLSIDKFDNVYVADDSNQRVRKITPAGVVTTVFGVPGTLNVNPGPVLIGSARLGPAPEAIAVDNVGRIYVTGEYLNHLYRVQ